jgi:hypothetical protein
MPFTISDTTGGSDAIHPQHSQVEPASLEAHRFVRLHRPLGTPKRPACDWPLSWQPASTLPAVLVSGSFTQVDPTSAAAKLLATF